MKPMVLCISRTALYEQNIPHHGMDLYDFDLTQVKDDDYHFINRKVVDNKDNDVYQNIGFHLPQILPYIAITDGKGNYLSYSRKGSETRLHGSKSIGIGGHVDITDLDTTDIKKTIYTATDRELFEEAHIPLYQEYQFNKIIVDTSNSVGCVHVGLFTTLVYPNVIPQEELYNAEWLSLEELISNIHSYENWSRIVINGLKEQNKKVN